ncbi:DNA breaking-rejoining protein [Microbulbifer taiwanensis]|uniref:DNA breaking-rejoining protein n=1 Tax=Microbulbifer taiwanensis TaxID=986746 RepID=A0ABW1YKI7_9GAMM|nr:DNA breaking-rejoining protein [Microbulbifer taiwanensis]
MKMHRNYSLAELLALPAADQAQGTGAGNFRSQSETTFSTTSETTSDGTIRGNDTATYRLGATAGQHLHVLLQTDNASNYFNIYAPGKDPGEEALFTGSVDGNSYSAIVPADGLYTVQVFLMRNAAQRNESAHYKLHTVLKSGPKTSALENGNST